MDRWGSNFFNVFGGKVGTGSGLWSDNLVHEMKLAPQGKNFEVYAISVSAMVTHNGKFTWDDLNGVSK